jgi:hypothetical protein
MLRSEFNQLIKHCHALTSGVVRLEQDIARKSEHTAKIIYFLPLESRHDVSFQNSKHITMECKNRVKRKTTTSKQTNPKNKHKRAIS